MVCPLAFCVSHIRRHLVPRVGEWRADLEVKCDAPPHLYKCLAHDAAVCVAPFVWPVPPPG